MTISAFIWTGSAFGAMLGVLHGVYVYRQVASRVTITGQSRSAAAGLYYALWTFVLWTAFGSYVLALWILGAVAFSVARAMSALRAN